MMQTIFPNNQCWIKRGFIYTEGPVSKIQTILNKVWTYDVNVGDEVAEEGRGDCQSPDDILLVLPVVNVDKLRADVGLGRCGLRRSPVQGCETQRG